MAQQLQPQTVPVRVYQSDRRIMVAAPMPGLEPEDISVTVAGDAVTIQGPLRGVRQDERDLLLEEWTVGPYYREVILPMHVDGEHSNATYDNGVLVLILPKLEAAPSSAPAKYKLDPLTSTHGERVGHVGRYIEPTTTDEHRLEVKQTALAAGAECEPHSAR